MESKTTTGKAALVVVLIFITGFLAGAGSFAALWYIKFRPLAFMKNQGHVMGVLARKLDLSDAQRAGVEIILKETRRDLMAMRNEMRPRIMQRLEQTEQGVSRLLNDEQKKEFSRLVQRRKKMWLKMKGEANNE